MAFDEEDKKSTWRDLIPIIFLMFVPPVGAILMWLFARWTAWTKWIVTLIVILQLLLIGNYSYQVYKFVQFQRDYSSVLAVQQALDIYGLSNGKYPATLDDLQPKYLIGIPKDKSLDYKASDDSKSYTLKATVQGKAVELRPVFTQLPSSTK